MNTHHDNDTVGAYVLDALAPDEFEEFEAHLQGCGSCRIEVAELRRVVDILPLAVELVEPPQGLRDQILAEVEPASVRDRLTVLPGESAPPAVRTPWRNRAVFGGAMAAVLIGAVGVWSLQSQHQGGQQTAYTRDVLAARAAGSYVAPLTAAVEHRGVKVALVQPRGNKPAYLIVNGLSAPPPHHVYEVWLVHGQAAPRSARIFSVSGSNAQIIQLTLSAHGFDTAAMTVEPAPHGSTAPTTAAVVQGTLSA